MATFILDCEAVTSLANSISSLSSQTENLASSIAGYDTSNEDGFDFETAKGVLQKNMEATTKKIENTVKLMNSVVESHTKLQQSLGSGEIPGKEANNQSQSSTNTGGNTRASRNYSGGSGSSGYNRSGSSAGGHYGGRSSASVSSAKLLNNAVTNKKIDDDSIINYTNYKKVLSSEEQKELKDKYQLTTEDGYLMIDDCYVIACNDEIGKVGDIVEITQKDGTKIECIVGKELEIKQSEKTDNKISFLISGSESKKELIDSNLNDIKIKNLGTYQQAVISDTLKSEINETLNNAILPEELKNQTIIEDETKKEETING